MPLQEIVTPWDQQPQEWADIDWGNPSAGALVGLWSGSTAPIEIASGSPRSGGDNVSLVEYRATSEGQAQSTQVSSDNVGVKFTLVRPTPAASAFTIVCRFQIKAIPGGDRDIVRFANPSGESAQVILRSTGAIRGATIRANTTVDSSATYTAGTWITAVYVGRSGDFRLWINGVRQAASGTSDLGPFQQRNEIHIRSSDASTVFAACFNAALSDAEVISFSANPWQLFVRRNWVSMAAASGNQTLTPALFTNSSTFYSAVVSQAGGAQSLTPSLYTNTSAFYPATVAPGAVSLAPSLFTNSGTFYSATVSLGGSPQTLTPALFTNPQSFFAPTVSPGAVNLAPALFTNAQTFYAPVVTNGVTLAPPLLTNSQTFYGASITLGPAVLRPALLANVNQFYTHALTGGVVRIKQKGLRKTRYTPGRVPSDAKELARFIQNELERLTDALESPFTHQLLEVLHAEPTRKPTGSAMVAFADGTDWNPGAGRGLYLYDPQTAAWTKL